MELTTSPSGPAKIQGLFMMSKIQNLNGTHNHCYLLFQNKMLFMMSKIQNLNGTHNLCHCVKVSSPVVYDVKDTKSEYKVQSTKYRVVPYAKIIPTVGLVG